ncbi:MAG: Multidrug resistance protein MexB [Chlamydiae bacterium]|nr:Multidrug resistance protein MexB [Chlamydiota bacterium]
MNKGPIAWMTRNHVTANLLMLLFIVGGLIIGSQLKQEVFPEFELDIISVSVPYPGASPEEIENGIIQAIEDEVRGVDGVKRVTSSSFEGRGIVNIELLSGMNANKALQDVKNAVDRITSFPEEAERPIVSLLETRRQVIALILYGDVSRKILRDLGEKVRDDLIQLPDITLVSLADVPPLEISIEIPRQRLRSYNLTLEQIANIINETSIELPAGGVKTPGGEILLRTKERRDYASQYENIPVISNPDGSRILLSDIATIKEGFEETDQEAFFNGYPAIKVEIFRVGAQTPIAIADKVHQYAKNLQSELPSNIKVATWNDRAELYRDRINLLIRNASLGLFLVLMFLGLILEPRLAFWVTLGIPISIIGSFIFVAPTPVSINMVSLFAFIVTLGIIVDDAIVVGENIYKKREAGLSNIRAAIEGAQELAGPVTFAVLTNIAAFIPLFFIPGPIGNIFLQIPIIVIAVFAVSLIESIFILPSHLARRHQKSKFWDTLSKPSIYFDRLLDNFIKRFYQNHLKTALKYRYISMGCGIGLLIIALGLVYSGIVTFSYLPRVDHDLITAQAKLPVGIPITKSREVQKILVEAAQEVIKETETGNISRGIYTQIGNDVIGTGPQTGPEDQETGSHIVGAQVLLVPSDQREISGIEFSKQWRKKVGDIAGVDSIGYIATIGIGTGDTIDIQLSHPIREINEQAAQELADILRTYEGVFQIDNGVTLGKQQINFTIKPEARSLGITVNQLAKQVRSAFYGAEALRLQRGRNEIKVMVRLPLEERQTPFTVEDLIIRTADGGEIPLSEAANITLGNAFTEIKRNDGRRIISVTADVDEAVANANEIIADITGKVIPALQEKYPGLTYRLEGVQREQAETLEAIWLGLSVAIIAIYILLAIPFKSYMQPLIVMTSIPFGIIGAIIGHLLLGYELSIISMFGIIALSGVVVNDSLVLIITINRMKITEDLTLKDMVIRTGMLRFRPIILTSLTTFFGLAPMIFETSIQARFLIPMAISLGFGVLFATSIILLLVPCLYMILEDVKSGIKRT